MFSRRIVGVSKSLVRNVHIEAKLESMGITIPPVPTPKGSYTNMTRIGNVAFLAGHLPQPVGGDMVVGKVGVDVTPEEANVAARYVGLNMIATLKYNLGDLDKVKRITKLVGFVNCADGFAAQPSVINGCSDLMFEVFGDKGVHARSAVGTNALPLNVAVEIEAIVELEDE